MLQPFIYKIKPLLLKTKNGLNSDEAVANSGLALGLVHSYDKEIFLDSPLVSVFCGMICGFITSIGATCVSVITPAKIRFIIPVAVMASCTHHILKPTKYSE